MDTMEVFDPSTLSLQEAEFVLAHVGKPWSAVSEHIRVITVPDRSPRGYSLMTADGVVAAAVKPIIDRVFELEAERTQMGRQWVGVEAVKEAVSIFLTAAKKWETDAKRGAPRFPPMATFNARGVAAPGAAGSDSGVVKSYFDAQGQRKAFALNLRGADRPVWEPDWVKQVAKSDESVSKGLKNDAEKNRLECLICGHTESYNADSRSSFNAARARISRHLTRATKDVEAHRETHSLEFGGQR